MEDKHPMIYEKLIQANRESHTQTVIARYSQSGIPEDILWACFPIPRDPPANYDGSVDMYMESTPNATYPPACLEHPNPMPNCSSCSNVFFRPASVNSSAPTAHEALTHNIYSSSRPGPQLDLANARTPRFYSHSSQPPFDP